MQEVLRVIARAKHTFLKFLSANDLGLTGSHQAGIYLTKECWRLFLDQPGGNENIEQQVSLNWGDGRATMSFFKWYGEGTRSEYRLTRVKDIFRDQEERYLGALFVLMLTDEGYEARLLDREPAIDSVLDFLGITPAESGRMLRFDLEERLRPFCEAYAAQFGQSFPDTADIARRAQMIFYDLYKETGFENPDRALLSLIEIEYALFRFVERQVYQPLLERPFGELEPLLAISLEINNRRKSRAGRSLENHLRFILQRLRIRHEFGAPTEGDKKPDFLFPGSLEYRDKQFPAEMNNFSSQLFFNEFDNSK